MFSIVVRGERWSYAFLGGGTLGYDERPIVRSAIEMYLDGRKIGLLSEDEYRVVLRNEGNTAMLEGFSGHLIYGEITTKEVDDGKLLFLIRPRKQDSKHVH